jgi:hypothetical protein
MTWQRIPESQILHTPIAVRAIDDLTGGAPLAPVSFALDWQDGPRWVATGIDPVRTPSGITAWPGLGRVQDPVATPARRYRVRFADQDDLRIYRPAYAFLLDGLEFDVDPWNDAIPPTTSLGAPERVFLWPGVAYPFPRTLPLLRGRTIDGGGAPLADARITGANDHVLSDATGNFCLPIRLTNAAASILVTAEHQRSGVSGAITVALPRGLGTSVDIQLV